MQTIYLFKENVNDDLTTTVHRTTKTHTAIKY